MYYGSGTVDRIASGQLVDTASAAYAAADAGQMLHVHSHCMVLMIIIMVMIVALFVQAIKALEQYPTPKSRHALTSTIENEKCFYLIRIDAAQSLAKVSVFCSCHIGSIICSIEDVMFLTGFVSLTSGLLKKLWMNFYEIFGKNKPLDEKQIIQIFCPLDQYSVICFHCFIIMKVSCIHAAELSTVGNPSHYVGACEVRHN